MDKTKYSIPEKGKEFDSEELVIETPVGTIELAGLMMKEPKEVIRRAPVVLLPGWGETIETTKELALEIAQSGRPIWRISHSREQLPDEANEEELAKAIAINFALESQNIERVHAVAHSEGAINVTLAALMKPKLYESIIYVGPAGLDGQKGFFSLARRYTRDGLERITKSLYGNTAEARSLLETTKYILTNATKSLKEAFEISNSQTLGSIKLIHACGIKTFLIHGVDDPVFSMKGMQKEISKGVFDGVCSVKGGHEIPYLAPGVYGPVLIDIINKAENPKKD